MNSDSYFVLVKILRQDKIGKPLRDPYDVDYQVLTAAGLARRDMAPCLSTVIESHRSLRRPLVGTAR
ncbi:hypothetical protein RRG08_012235 [Elysia crispata]|uniref:Uncharacterized protein n=1 Tax=Elysia crispata TaxID=231223 RepID=A0AAE0YPA7_9GAST|nr:hypothetical protein RRG08_012235 [Elysia crispata]